MHGDRDDGPHRGERFIPAPAEMVYAALTHADRLVRWLPPEGASAHIDQFEPHAGGRIRITLTFAGATGKTSSHTDVVEGRFAELVPGQRVVQEFTFRSDDPAFAGVMRMAWELRPEAGGTRVEVTATDVPRGIKRADHEEAMASSLAKLAAFVATAT